MTIYVLKAHEPDPDLRHPDVTRRAQQPDSLNRLTIPVHPTLEAAQFAAQASYDKAYDNHPEPDVDPEDDEYRRLEWIGDDHAYCDYTEAEYGIERVEGFDATERRRG